MERASRDLSGVKDGSSARGGDTEKDKDIDSQSDDSEDDEHSDIPGQNTASMSSEEDSYSDESAMELFDSESVRTIFAPQTSPWGAKNSGGNRKKIGRYFTDRIYLDRMSRQERRRIEGEMIKGRKPGECHSVT